MVPFAGYEMPVQYPAGIIDEHKHTREKAGLFDVSHMGQAWLHGDGAAATLETLVPGDIQALAHAQGRYTMITNDTGGIVDDLIVTNWSDKIFIVVNASRKDIDLPLIAAAAAIKGRSISFRDAFTTMKILSDQFVTIRSSTMPPVSFVIIV